jgi:choline dehydrogenase-like flavoprotein
VSVEAAPEAAPGAVRVYAEYDRDIHEETDVVVVGSGPSGSVVAFEIAQAGHRVVLLEEGPPLRVEDFELDASRSMARTMREAGLRATTGSVISTMQAICLGGGSVVNSAICPRPPAFVFDRWSTRFDLAQTTRADLEPHFDAVGEFLGIAPTPEAVQGQRNLLFRDGCERLGISSEPIPRNVRGCRGSGECFTGCRSHAKQSMDISYIPAAIESGAQVFTSVQVQKVRSNGSRVGGVEGQVVEPFTGRRSHRVRVDARYVVLAAGCMATPVLLQHSGSLANASGQVGRNLQFHPGVAVAGIFPEPINPQFGATQGYHSLAFLEEGFKLETLWAPAPVLAVRTPGSGAELQQRFAEISKLAVWDGIISADHSLGSVKARWRSLDPALRWNLDPRDVKTMLRALYVLSEIFFAAGAQKIMTGVRGMPDELFSLEEAEPLRSEVFPPNAMLTGGNHAFCTTRMHGDPKQGVVDEFGRCHDLDNLYIADTGIFPQCTSVNPMFTGMALARRQALQLVERL